jgi:hypothetical protein
MGRRPTGISHCANVSIVDACGNIRRVFAFESASRTSVKREHSALTPCQARPCVMTNRNQLHASSLRPGACLEVRTRPVVGYRNTARFLVRLALLKTDAGMSEVEAELVRIDWGDFA